MKKLTTMAAAVLFAATMNAQQWNGNSNVTDPIERDGRVSIGTTISDEKLSILGGVRLKVNSSLPSVEVQGFPPAQDLQNSLVLGNGYSGSRHFPSFYITRFAEGLQISPSHLVMIDGSFQIFKESASPTFFISNSKRIGLGTYAIDCVDCTDYRLFVKDGIKTEKVKVEIAASNGWADYVFEEDYPLMPLNELDQFIKTNGHLPEVPTTEEAIANGIELKEMNILLLKKVEELTLYTLQQQEQLDEQKQQLQKQAEELKKITGHFSSH